MIALLNMYYNLDNWDWRGYDVKHKYLLNINMF